MVILLQGRSSCTQFRRLVSSRVRSRIVVSDSWVAWTEQNKGNPDAAASRDHAGNGRNDGSPTAASTLSLLMLTVAEVATTFGVSPHWPKLLVSSATSKLNMDRPLRCRAGAAGKRGCLDNGHVFTACKQAAARCTPSFNSAVHRTASRQGFYLPTDFIAMANFPAKSDSDIVVSLMPAFSNHGFRRRLCAHSSSPIFPSPFLSMLAK